MARSDLPSELKKPVTPTTAFALSSSSVFAGSFRSTLLALIAAATGFGTASMSTFRPSSSAVLGLTPGPTPPTFSPSIA